MTDDERWIAEALVVAREAASAGEVPVGAIVVRDGVAIARAGNRTVRDQDPTAHAEVLALRGAAVALGTWRLTDCVLYVTLEPCAMCAGASVLARVKGVVFGAWDKKGGGAGSIVDIFSLPQLNHRVDVFGGVLMEESARLLNGFFAALRSSTPG